jgi:hypothetical protein
VASLAGLWRLPDTSTLCWNALRRRLQQQGRLEGPAPPKLLSNKAAGRGGAFALPGFQAAEVLRPPLPAAADAVPRGFTGRHAFAPAPAAQGQPLNAPVVGLWRVAILSHC